MAIEFKITKDPFIVKIPMKPYVVKFMKKKFGEKHKVSKCNWLGRSLVRLLSKDFKKPKKNTSKSYFTIQIPYTLCLRYGHFIDYDNLQEVEKICEDIFRNFMVDHAQINAVNGNFGQIMSSIKNFLAFYNISEDDLKLDSAYRQYLRVVEKKVLNKTKKIKSKIY